MRLFPRSEERFGSPSLAVGFGESSAGCRFVSWGLLSFAIKNLLTAHSEEWFRKRLIYGLLERPSTNPCPLMSSFRRAFICVIRLSDLLAIKLQLTLTFRRTSLSLSTWPPVLFGFQLTFGRLPHSEEYRRRLRVRLIAHEPSTDPWSTSTDTGLPGAFYWGSLVAPKSGLTATDTPPRSHELSSATPRLLRRSEERPGSRGCHRTSR